MLLFPVCLRISMYGHSCRARWRRPGGTASAGAVPSQRSARACPQGARAGSRPPGCLDRAADHRDRAQGVRGHRRGYRRAADRPAASPPGRLGGTRGRRARDARGRAGLRGPDRVRAQHPGRRKRLQTESARPSWTTHTSPSTVQIVNPNSSYAYSNSTARPISSAERNASSAETLRPSSSISSARALGMT